LQQVEGQILANPELDSRTFTSSGYPFFLTQVYLSQALAAPCYTGVKYHLRTQLSQLSINIYLDLDADFTLSSGMEVRYAIWKI
jgi:hypothetical protein